jgi:hypothetical protein
MFFEFVNSDSFFDSTSIVIVFDVQFLQQILHSNLIIQLNLLQNLMVNFMDH